MALLALGTIILTESFLHTSHSTLFRLENLRHAIAEEVNVLMQTRGALPRDLGDHPQRNHFESITLENEDGKTTTHEVEIWLQMESSGITWYFRFTESSRTGGGSSQWTGPYWTP